MIDRVVFGDNQFFGINHMSRQKAQELAEKFSDFAAIRRVYDLAFEAGIRAVMLNSNERAGEICDHFRRHRDRYRDIAWYPSIPYPHKYAHLVAEKGILPALGEVMFRDGTAAGLGMAGRGGAAVLGRDALGMMRLLVDAELKIFRDLDVRAVFLQNIVTDLLLGYELKDFFAGYCEHIRRRYRAVPGLITQNLPRLLDRLGAWGIRGVAVCASFNRLGYLMSPDLASCEAAVARNNPADYPLMAMSIFASGAVPARAACEFVAGRNFQSVVFGASSGEHIRETARLLGLPPVGPAGGAGYPPRSGSCYHNDSANPADEREPGR